MYRLAHSLSCSDPRCPICGLAEPETAIASAGSVGDAIVAGFYAWLTTRAGRRAQAIAVRADDRRRWGDGR
jgi:hypothetical protein